jgi:hypothetical protein
MFGLKTFLATFSGPRSFPDTCNLSVNKTVYPPLMQCIHIFYSKELPVLENTSSNKCLKIILFCNMNMRKASITNRGTENELLTANPRNGSLCESFVRSSGSITSESCCFPSVQKTIQRPQVGTYIVYFLKNDTQASSL